MIVRSSVHWLRMLFVWRGSILPVILPQLITITVLAIVVTVIPVVIAPAPACESACVARRA